MHNYYEEIEKRMNECVLHVPFMFATYTLAPNGPEKWGCRMRIRDLFIKIRDLFSITRLRD